MIVNVAGPYMLAEGEAQLFRRLDCDYPFAAHQLLEVLVDACIWCKAHYVDVSMEAGYSCVFSRAEFNRIPASGSLESPGEGQHSLPHVHFSINLASELEQELHRYAMDVGISVLEQLS